MKGPRDNLPIVMIMGGGRSSGILKLISNLSDVCNVVLVDENENDIPLDAPSLLGSFNPMFLRAPSYDSFMDYSPIEEAKGDGHNQGHSMKYYTENNLRAIRRPQYYKRMMPANRYN
ncbi:hypothetical protein HN747_03255 [archaeon]|jgi:hypothetical protein|nr:hypothetical protein [archaeon]